MKNKKMMMVIKKKIMKKMRMMMLKMKKNIMMVINTLIFLYLRYCKMQRRKLGYDLRKGDAVLNNFELRKINGRETEDEVIMLLCCKI